MATLAKIGNGKLTARPGTYSIITSKISNLAPGLSYGKILIVDTGIGANFGAGSGVKGELAKDKEAVYNFKTVQDFQSFLKGGKLWSLGPALYKPKAGVVGVSEVYYVSAKESTAATKELALTNGTISVKTKDEGSIANGQLTGLNLSKGYAQKLVAVAGGKFKLQFWLGSYAGADSLNDEDYGDSALLAKPELIAETPALSTIQEIKAWMAKDRSFRDAFIDNGTAAAPAATLLAPVIQNQFIFDYSFSQLAPATYFYKVSALNANGETIGSTEISLGVGADQYVYFWWDAVVGATSYRVYRGTTTNAQSVYFSLPSTQTLFQDLGFSPGTTGTVPTVNTATTSVTGGIISADVTNNPGYQLFAGGTETYTADAMQKALTAIRELDYTFILATEYGTIEAATSENNFALFEHILPTGNAKFTKFLVIPGGYDDAEFEDSKEIAATYDSQQAIVVHSGYGLTRRGGEFKLYDQLDQAARILGRGCGLEPQTPWTFKSLGIDKLTHAISIDEEEEAIAAGVLAPKYDDDLKSFVIGLDVNSLQNNEFFINDDGTSYNIAVNRIKAQLNKEIIIEGKKRFFSGESGPNRNTISEQEIIDWVDKKFLKSRVADDNKDNLILGYKNILVTREEDNYYVSYEFIPNTEIKAIVFNGIIING